MIFLGVVYLVAGITFGALAGWSASNQMRTTWRLAAWLTSAVAFAAYIWCVLFLAMSLGFAQRPSSRVAELVRQLTKAAGSNAD